MQKSKLILGAIAGDIIGSVYEWDNVKSVVFPLFGKDTDFTDDSVLTVATMDTILNSSGYADNYQNYARMYPNRGYGGKFSGWIHSANPCPYYSWGNGSAMRVSPVGWAFNTLEEVMAEAERSAEVTHNHPEGIKGAGATAAAIFLARTGSSKTEIREYVETTFGYDLKRSIDEIRPAFRFDESCQGTVPESIIAFLESNDFESAIRLAISLGGDSDTIACITGGIAEAFYREVPDKILEEMLYRIPEELKKIIIKFSVKFKTE